MRNWTKQATERVRRWSRAQKLLAALLGIGSIALLFAGRANHQAARTAPMTQDAGLENWDSPVGDRLIDNRDEQGLGARIAGNDTSVTAKELARLPGTTALTPPYVTPNPMIAHSAELAVATKQFAQARTTLEEILER